MIAYVRRLAIPAATLMALHCAPADAAHFVFTILTPPNQTGPAYVTGMHQDQAVGYTNGPDGQDYVSFVYSAGNYTILPAIPFFYGVTDSGLAFGYSANSEKAYSTYDLLSGATTTYNFAPPGNSTFAIGGMNAAGDVIATQVTSIGNNTSSCQPFEQAPDGSYTYLASLKSPTGLFGVGQTDSGVTVLGSGSCQDGHPGAPYFLVTNGKTTAFNIPNSQTVSVLFVSGDEFGGSFTDTNTQKILGFTSKGGKVVTYTVPTAIFGTYVTGVNAQGEVVGFFFDSKRNQHGFNYFGKTYYKIDYYKNNSNTEIDGISSTGAIFGHYENGQGHNLPFIATCPGGERCTH